MPNMMEIASDKVKGKGVDHRLTRQFALMFAPGFQRPDLAASWHMLVPPLFDMWMSSTAGRDAREQLIAPAKALIIEGVTCDKASSGKGYQIYQDVRI